MEPPYILPARASRPGLCRPARNDAQGCLLARHQTPRQWVGGTGSASSVSGAALARSYCSSQHCSACSHWLPEPTTT